MKAFRQLIQKTAKRSLLLVLVVALLSVTILPPKKTLAQVCTESYLRNRQVAILNCTGDEECATDAGGGTLEGENNAVAAYNYLITTLNLTPAQVSGIIGNLMNESGSNTYDLVPDIVGEGMCSNGTDCRGIAQWSESRWAALEAWAVQQGLNPLTLEAQVGYIVEELTNVDGHWSVTLGNLQAIQGHDEAAAREAAAEWNDTYEVGVNTPQRQTNAAQFFREYAQADDPAPGGGRTGGGTIGGGGADCPAPTLGEVECPANLEPHPSVAGYYRMPDSPNNEYHVYSQPERRWGSQQLICALHTVGLRYFEERGGDSRLMIGNLNTPYGQPSVSHMWGTANDQYAAGDVWAASHVDDGGRYDDDATIALGILWVETGMLEDIWWCPPDAPNEGNDNGRSQNAIRNHAPGPAGQIRCIDGHRDHFHVNILEEFRLECFPENRGQNGC